MELKQPSKEELLQSIHPDMRLTKIFFKRIYAYEVTWPGFAGQAIAALEAAGCSRARQYYEAWVSEYETARNAELREVAAWYRRWSSQQEEKEVKEVRKNKQKFQNLTRHELTELCRKLLNEGVITSPEQFVTLAEQDH